MDLISKAFHDLNAIMEGHNNNFSWFFLQLNCRNWLGTEEYKKINARAIGLLNTNLRSKHALVKVKKFEMHATEEEILQVLPYFDPKSIKSLDLHIHDHKKEKLVITEMDHWKNADDVSVVGIKFDLTVHDFLHFSKVSVALHTISAEKVIFLK